MKYIFKKNRKNPVLLFTLLLIQNYVFCQDYSWEASIKADLEKMADSLTTHLTPWDVPDTVFFVEQYGVVGDSITINTAAIQQAVDNCSAAGGGVVLFSAGNYVTGTIRLKQGVMLEVAKGARILGSTDTADYPKIKEQFKSVMSENHKYRQSLIYAELAEKIGIRGKGEIYFRGEKKNFPGEETVGEIIGRPFGMRFIQCGKIVMENITLRNSAAWMQSYLYCSDMIFDSMTVISDANYNNDGLDIDGCTGVIVRNCFIFSEDDAMCFKGCSNMPTQNILVENSTFVTTCNAFKIGTDTQGPFRNIIARNLVLGGVPDSFPSTRGYQASTGITLATVDGGDIENIYIHDITIEKSRCPVFIRIGKRGRVMPGLPKPSVGCLKKVLIENVTGTGNHRQGSFISGISGNKIEDVIIRNYQVEMEGGGTPDMAGAPVAENEYGYPDAHQFSASGLPAYGYYIRHAQNIWLDTVNITPTMADARPEFISGGDVANININGGGIEEQTIIVINYTQKYIDNVRIFAPSSSYKVDSARVGARYFNDRTFNFTALHNSVKGGEFICWQNGLKSTFANVLMSFTVNRNGKVYVAHDNRLAKPAWLTSGFTKTAYQIPLSGANATLFEKPVNKNETVELGANQVKDTETGNCNNYLVFFVPGPEISGSDGLKADILKIFPNPASTRFVFEFPSIEDYSIKLFSMQGTLVYDYCANGPSHEIDTRSMPDGIYGITCFSPSYNINGKIVIKK